MSVAHRLAATTQVVLHVQDHFVFTVESTGALTPYDIVRQSITIMYSKLEVLHRSLEGNDQPAAMDMNMG